MRRDYSKKSRFVTPALGRALLPLFDKEQLGRVAAARLVTRHQSAPPRGRRGRRTARRSSQAKDSDDGDSGAAHPREACHVQ